MATRTRINAAHIIATQNNEHRHLRDGVVVYEGDRIVHVGKSFDGEADQTIDLPHGVVTPGFINTHAHLAGSPLDKSFIEDVGPRQFYGSGLFEYLPVRGGAQDAEADVACLAFSMAELLRTGTTTIMEIGHRAPEAVEQANKVGMRLYMGLGYRSGRWLTTDGKRVAWEWDEPAGYAGMDRAIKFIEDYDGQSNGRIKGFLSPMQIDTCTEDLLRKSKEAADSMGVPIALHAAQSVNEFNEMVARHGRTPIEWLEDIDFLDSNVILGHAIILAGGSWANYAGNDIEILAGPTPTSPIASGSLPGAESRWSPSRATPSAGVNMTLGTDTAPQSHARGAALGSGRQQDR